MCAPQGEITPDPSDPTFFQRNEIIDQWYKVGGREEGNRNNQISLRFKKQQLGTWNGRIIMDHSEMKALVEQRGLLRRMRADLLARRSECLADLAKLNETLRTKRLELAEIHEELRLLKDSA
jgi:hypothetical protein